MLDTNGWLLDHMFLTLDVLNIIVIMSSTCIKLEICGQCVSKGHNSEGCSNDAKCPICGEIIPLVHSAALLKSKKKLFCP